MKHFNRS